jgi:Kef-type K+ transport system membrane component KefB
MGLHLDMTTLWAIHTDVFGLGMAQFTSTALVVGTFCFTGLRMLSAASLIIGWSLTLSSSTFVLQLLKDTKQTDSVYSKSSFGILHLQDLMVVPLLVMTPSWPRETAVVVAEVATIRSELPLPKPSCP